MGNNQFGPYNQNNMMNNSQMGFGNGRNMMGSLGKFYVKPVSASITGRDTETFGSMDPYLKVCYPINSSEQRTKTATGM